MSQLKKDVLLDLSTGHLSPMTIDKIGADKLGMSVLIRDEGFMLYTRHFGSESGQDWPADFPADLKNCLRFAAANGADWLLMDRDTPAIEELPWYEGNTDAEPGSIATAHGIPAEKRIGIYTPKDLLLYTAYDLDRVPDHALRQGSPVIADGDYEAPDGCWIGISGAAVRVRPNDEGGVSVAVYRNGEEDGPSFGEIHLRAQDLEPEDTPAP